MGSHAALIAELEEVKEGSWALSDEVLMALGWTVEQLPANRVGVLGWKRPDGIWAGAPPRPTTNLQDTVDLVPEGRWWTTGSHRLGPITDEHDSGPWAIVWNGIFPRGRGFAAIPALSLCIAILKAVEAEGGKP